MSPGVLSLEFLEVSSAARAHHRGRIPCCICVENDVWSTDNVPVVLRFLELSRARVGLKRRVGSVSCGAARLRVWSRRWLKRTFVTCPRDSPRDSPHDHDRLPRLTKRWLRTRLSDDGSIASRPNHDQVVGVNGEAEWPGDSSSFSGSGLFDFGEQGGAAVRWRFAGSGRRLRCGLRRLAAARSLLGGI